MAGYLIHPKPHPMKGMTFKDGGVTYTVLDWYDRQTGRTFLSQDGDDKLSKSYRNMRKVELAKGRKVPRDEHVVVVSSSMGLRLFHSTQIDERIMNNGNSEGQRRNYQG